MLLWFDGRAIGVVRIDVEPPYGILRRVAISEQYQRQGHGRQLIRLAEDFARRAGCSIAASNVDADALGFYRSLGYARGRKDSDLWLEKPL